jgi:hypothetical protein
VPTQGMRAFRRGREYPQSQRRIRLQLARLRARLLAEAVRPRFEERGERAGGGDVGRRSPGMARRRHAWAAATRRHAWCSAEPASTEPDLDPVPAARPGQQCRHDQPAGVVRRHGRQQAAVQAERILQRRQPAHAQAQPLPSQPQLKGPDEPGLRRGAGYQNLQVGSVDAMAGDQGLGPHRAQVWRGAGAFPMLQPAIAADGVELRPGQNSDFSRHASVRAIRRECGARASAPPCARG